MDPGSKELIDALQSEISRVIQVGTAIVIGVVGAMKWLLAIIAKSNSSAAEADQRVHARIDAFIEKVSDGRQTDMQRMSEKFDEMRDHLDLIKESMIRAVSGSCRHHVLPPPND
jgi:GTP cyclohydrolase I